MVLEAVGGGGDERAHVGGMWPLVAAGLWATGCDAGRVPLQPPPLVAALDADCLPPWNLTLSALGAELWCDRLAALNVRMLTP